MKSEATVTLPIEEYNRLMLENTEVRKALDNNKLVLNSHGLFDDDRWCVVNESVVIRELNDRIKLLVDRLELKEESENKSWIKTLFR